jgi:hypothetical protein
LKMFLMRTIINQSKTNNPCKSRVIRDPCLSGSILFNPWLSFP